MIQVFRAFLAVVVVGIGLVVPAQACGCAGRVVDMLLPAEAVGPGFVVKETGTRTLEELAATFADPKDTAIRLDAWGWRETVYRTYVQGSETVQLSYYRFDSEHGAILALPFFLETRSAALGLREVPSWADPRTYTITRSVTGVVNGGSEYTTYKQIGSLLIRVTISAPVNVNNPSAEAGLAYGVNHILGEINHSFGI
ncbi:MAG: hypothetical protein M3Z20_02430 [Chloroflexota bacterium]|nr:hypothetical protein [Chloroflexota bacterium]